MVKEPQGVQELMAQTEAEWERQIATCDDATGPERTALREALGALRGEYADADYPRREAIERELRALIRRYEALPSAGGVAPERTAEPAPDAFAAPPLEGGEPGEAAGVDPPTEEVSPARETEDEPPGAPAAEALPDDATEPAPHGPVALGMEAAPPGRESPPPAPDVPEPEAGPEAAVEEAPVTAEPEAAAGAPGPVPHGSPGLSRDVVGETGSSGGAGRDTARPPKGKWEGLWQTARGTAVRWVKEARLRAEYEVLLRKREARSMELGIRVWQLSERNALEEAATDAGVRERLRQIERVEAAIRENRDRAEALDEAD